MDNDTGGIMVKHFFWLVLSLSGLALCGAAYFFWYITLDHRAADKATLSTIESVVTDEPITPIPLDLLLDERKVSLGRRIFHDPRLSHDNTISCAHCHSLANGGMDGLPLSIGINGKMSKVNTPTVFNSGFNFRLFWDGRAATLEEQIDFPLTNPDEMNSNWDEVLAKIGKDADYLSDFADIYSEGIEPHTIKDAIATFERSLITPNSKFDRYLRGDKHALDSAELAGYDLFKSFGCISCHQGMNVGGNLYEKFGIVNDYFSNRGHIQKSDFGRYNVTNIESDRFQFRVPSLRNVAVTAPYFHDGSVSNLAGAVVIMGKYQLGVDLREEEVALIVKFLNALTGEYDGEPLLVSTQSKALR